MEDAASSKAFRDESAKSTKSVAFGKLSTPLKSDHDRQQVSSPQTISQTSSMSVNARGNVKIEDKLNYYHLVELNELFKVAKCVFIDSLHRVASLYSNSTFISYVTNSISYRGPAMLCWNFS